MTFADQIRPLIMRLGTNEAARICEVTPRTLQLWMKGQGNPNAATRTGAVVLLTRSKKKS